MRLSPLLMVLALDRRIPQQLLLDNPDKNQAEVAITFAALGCKG